MSDVPSDDGEGMLDRIDPPAALAEPEAPEDDLLELLLRLEREVAAEERVVDLLLRGLRDQRDQPLLQAREDLAHLGRLHPRLEVVEQRVVGLVDLEARRVLAPKLDVALEVRAEELEVVRPARLDPDGERLRGSAGLLLAQLARDLQLLLAVAAGDADQARLVGVEVERLLVRPELFEQRADLVGDEELVDHLRGRRRAGAARTPPPCGGIIVCWSQAASAAELGEIPDLAQATRVSSSYRPRSRADPTSLRRRSAPAWARPFSSARNASSTARGSRRCRFAAIVSGSWKAPPQCAHGQRQGGHQRRRLAAREHAQELDDRRRSLDVA